MNNEVKFTINDIKVIINIVNLNISKEIIVSDLARELNISPSNPNFRKLIDKLLKFNGIKKIIKIGPAIVIKINNKQIIDYLWDSEDFKDYIDYFKKNHILYYG